MIYQRIRNICKDNGTTITAMGKELGISAGSIDCWKHGGFPRSDTLQKIADYFGVTTDYLLGVAESAPARVEHIPGIRPITKKRLPLLGTVACGEPQFAEQEYGLTVSAESELDADFCLIARGDSMINARIFDGDVLFVKSQDIVEDGEIAVILIEDSTTVKRVYYDRENSIITLMPENPKYKPMRYLGEQLDHIRILGKVVSGQYDVK